MFKLTREWVQLWVRELANDVVEIEMYDETLTSEGASIAFTLTLTQQKELMDLLKTSITNAGARGKRP